MTIDEIKHHYHVSYSFKSSNGSAVTNYGSFQYHTNTPYLTKESMDYIYERAHDVVHQDRSRTDNIVVIMSISYIGQCTHDQFFMRSQ